MQLIKLAERAVGFVARLISQLVGHEGNGCLKQGLRCLGRVQLTSEGQIGAQRRSQLTVELFTAFQCLE